LHLVKQIFIFLKEFPCISVMKLSLVLIAALFVILKFGSDLRALDKRPRVRDVEIQIGILKPGKWNAITDVSGVKVGHTTLIKDQNIRTGVTAILPHDGNLFQKKVPAAVYVGNGFGKLYGSTQVEELGNIETPIVLTNTLCVPKAADALIDYMLAIAGNADVRSINPLVGETNDGWLNDIRGRHITKDASNTRCHYWAGGGGLGGRRNRHCLPGF
jgi:D-aminopeptidase